MPTSQRAGSKQPRYVVVPKSISEEDDSFILNCEVVRNTLYFFDEGHSADLFVDWPLKDIVRIPRNSIRRRLWCLPCRDNEKHVVINDIAFPESLWEKLGIKIIRLYPKED